MERRGHPRVQVNAPCQILDLVADPASVEAITENISRSGLLLRLTATKAPVLLPSVGKVLTVHIQLPANPSFGPRTMRCRGRVVRISKGPGDLPRIALRIDQVTFRDGMLAGASCGDSHGYLFWR